MTFTIQPLRLGGARGAGVMESGTWTTRPTLSGLIVSLSIAALTLSMTIAVVISLIAWAVG